MDKKILIDYMFDELENSEAIKLKEDSNYLESLRTEDQIGQKISDFLKKRIHSKKTRNMLMKLIEDYSNSCRDTTYTANKIYYHRGFIDGIVFSND